jgi:hypothetical protein
VGITGLIPYCMACIASRLRGQAGLCWVRLAASESCHVAHTVTMFVVHAACSKMTVFHEILNKRRVYSNAKKVFLCSPGAK